MKKEENQKMGPRNLPKTDHIKSRADAERTISRFVAYRTSKYPSLFFPEGTRIIRHETRLFLIVSAFETNS